MHTTRILFATFLLACCNKGGQNDNTTTPETASEPAAKTETAEVAPMEADPTDVHIVGDHVTIDRHINFESDSDTILADSYDLLDHIALLISHHESELAHLKIVGHTDAAGGHEHNQDLSERRAASVMQALQERGVTILLESAGVGELEPICEEDTEECHSNNRRVEFIIVPDAPAI